MKRLRLLPLRIQCRAVARMPMPAFKGTVLYGTLGWAMEEVSPDLRRLLFPGKTGVTPRATPNPFALAPPLHAGPEFAAGETFDFGFTLLGCAVEALAPCIAGLQAMGRRGLGARGREVPFSIDLIEQRGPDARWHPLVAPDRGMWLGSPRSLDGAELVQPRLADGLEVAFLTPTDLRSGDQPCTRAPSFKSLFSRVLGRALMVGSELHDVELLDKASKADLINKADGIRLVADATCWRELERFSTKEKRLRHFGGLMGLAAYEGDMTPFIPWLALGEAFQVGKMTGSGFGVTAFRPPYFPGACHDSLKPDDSRSE